MLEARSGLKVTKHMLVYKQVVIFLYILAHHVKNIIIKHQFRHLGKSREMISSHFRSVLHAVIRLHEEFLKKPKPVPENSTDER